ncbi:asparaginase [Coniophora puteana RWD-64-598 SS2]|uniref:Asparaginase n=1 Tax=Coniophora puteana (strain RWD-64-598) TaxID=741705 RepID=A0A5M3MUM6_CONPW|nr:asparaginase [Coniophora puteana RWD-64-598 SS2]EIW82697.1 asparaginase [Coniophora puteana RWD-64-598 SS2]
MPSTKSTQTKGSQADKFTLVIHGGAGTMSRDGSTPEKQRRYRVMLGEALKAGHEVLQSGGEAMDAAVAAVSVMEDCPLFNAGKGAVFNVAGKNELEASLMLSRSPASHPAMPASRRGTSLTLLTRARNPSQLTRAIYLAPGLAPHPMLSGAASEELGAELGVELVDPSYFWTEARWREHQRGLGLPEEPVRYPGTPDSEIDVESTTDVGSVEGMKKEGVEGEEDWTPLDLMPTGTVGAVALDQRGCIAAVTSTGGRTNKLVGRVGDTPIMGAGFWAEEWKRDGSFFKKTWDKLRGKAKVQAVGVSGTGDGDYFIRQAAASTIARRMQYLDESVEQASQTVVSDLFTQGGIGGVIALDREGNYSLPLNSSGMYRGVVKPDGIPKTAIFFDEDVSELDPSHG